MSSYTGEVTVGGPADVRQLPGLTIAKLAVGSLNNNAYLLRCTASGTGLLIDAADEAGNVLGLSAIDGPLAERVLTTHRHYDHWQALAQVVAASGAATLAGENDAEGIEVPTTTPLSHGQTLALGELSLDVIELRGHTPGSMALYYDDPTGHGHLFTGDSLFPGGVGNTQGNASNFQSLITDVTKRLFDVYADDTWFYPGHGLDSTLGTERPHLDEWRERGW